MAELQHLGEILARTDLRQAQSWTPSGSGTKPAGKRGVPAGRMGNTFENFRRTPQMEAAYRQCVNVSAGDARCALLAGRYGNGKTHLAIAALHAYDGFQTGWFWKVPEFLQSIKTRAFDGDESVDDVIGPYQHGSSLVVFDDLGAENRTEWAAEQLYRVLDGRYDSGAPTIITTNCDPDQLDGRILDRYREGLVICQGESQR